MVSPDRIRHRIEKIEIDWHESDEDATFVSIIVDGQEKWYLGFTYDDRVFYLHRPIEDLGTMQFVNMTGRLRDYLVSILPPDVYAACIGRSIIYGKRED